jgi:hypothetical protein
MNRTHYQNMPNKSNDIKNITKKINLSENNLEVSYLTHHTNKINSKLLTSKIYQFENLPEPRNITEGIYQIILF